MHSLKQQILLLLLGSLILLATCFIVVLGWHMKDRAEAAAFIKVHTDLATCEEIIDKTYPGPWSLQKGDLYKGPIKISLANNLVDHLSALTGDAVTIFLGDTRVATTVLGSNNERAIGTKVSTSVAQTVLQDGQTFVGKANVVGQWYETGYVPLRAENGNIIGMFYIGISHAYDQTTITWSLITLVVLGLTLTLFAALITWYFLQKFIITPLHHIMLGTRDVATGHLTPKIKVSGAKEIEELEDAFNQMVERIQSFTSDITRTTGDFEHILNPNNYETSIADEQIPNRELGEAALKTTVEPLGLVDSTTVVTEPVDLADSGTVITEPPGLVSIKIEQCPSEELLPKGFNQATLDHIVQYVKTIGRPLSAEEVAEGVKLTRVTVRHYLEFLEQRGDLKSEQKYGRVGRPVKLFIP